MTISFCYPDPDPSFLKWIRPKDTDPTGSETLTVGGSLI